MVWLLDLEFYGIFLGRNTYPLCIQTAWIHVWVGVGLELTVISPVSATQHVRSTTTAAQTTLKYAKVSGNDTMLDL